MKTQDWQAGVWTHEPAAVVEENGGLLVTAVEASDAWRLTSYGFIKDSEHALVAPFPLGTAMEVDFTASFTEQFDQAGIFLRVSETHWVKAGTEYADGSLQVGAVVTDEYSDWSLAPVDEWLNKDVTIRVSREGNAVTVRAGLKGGPLSLVRLFPMAENLNVQAGPYVCAPTRAGLTIPFLGWRVGAADESLH